MRERIIRFMMGRYGVDDFSRFLMAIAFIFLVLNLIFRTGWFYILAIVVLAYCYYRILSKNHDKRYRENIKYTYYRDKAVNIFKREKSHMQQRKTHHIYTCRKCKQKIRIPKGKGKIQVTCPRCGFQFVKKS
ncbi:MAG: hypothetical protein K2M78_08815 [Lachnospiraceae bacterium]|nr:hypothetical protein [Lachnospiraceae bacterium]